MNLFCSLLVLFLLYLLGLEASNSNLGKITGGHEAQPHSNPYVISLQSRFLWLRYHICTGSIISEQWILSAGHCVTDSWVRWLAMDAIVGAHNLNKITRPMIYPISERVAHPMYSGGIGPYDIAMIRTSRKIFFSEKIQPIRLPDSASRSKQPDDLLITGWGAVQSNNYIPDVPNKLQEVEVTYLPYDECYEAVDLLKEDNELNPLKIIHNICTGPISGGIAGCTGDSGGPLVQYVPVISTQVDVADTTNNKEETVVSSTNASTTRDTASSTLMATDKTSTTTILSTTSAGSSTSPTATATDGPSATSGSYSASTISSASTSTPTKEAITPEADTTNSSRKTLLYNRVSYGKKYGTLNNLRGMRADTIPTVVGVLSWGLVPCGAKGAPTVYSNVTNYMDFINEYLYNSK